MAKSKKKIETQTFGVDSGTALVVDPAYLDEFMKYFDYDKFAESKDPVKYVKKVARKAFPLVKGKQMVALIQTGGDGIYKISIMTEGFSRTIKIEA